MRDPSVLDPAIRAYLEAENDYAKAALAHTEPLQETLFAEMKGRIKEDDSTVPSPDGPHAYYVRYREGGQHPIACRQPRDGGAEQVAARRRRARGRQGLLPARRQCSHSPDHRLLAWSADDKGSEYRHAARARSRDRRTTLPTRFPDVEGSPVWTADSSAFYYVRLDANHRPSRVFRHRLGTPASDDALVYEETGQPLLRLARPHAIRPLRRDLGARSRNLGMLADRPGDAGREAAAGRGARDLGALRRRASPELARRRDAGHPHQCGRRGGLQDRDRAARRSRAARTGAISCRTGAAPISSRVTVLAGLADPARARGRPAAHRGAAARERRGAHDRVSPRRPIRSARRAATSSRPTGCASTTRR